MGNEHFNDCLDSLLDSNINSESDKKQDVTEEQGTYTDNLVTKDDGICETINQLPNIFFNYDNNETYVFRHPKIISMYFAIVILLIISAFFGYCLAIGVETFLFSAELYSLGKSIAVISTFIIIFNIALIGRLISSIRFKSRYEIYRKLLGNISAEHVYDISVSSGKSSRKVIKDLKKAVKQGLIPQGHFSTGNNVFIITDEAYYLYKNHSSEYDMHFQKIIEERDCIERY